MAPAAKRKKPDDDPVASTNKTASAAAKPRATKKQKTVADPSASIETPPPTPKATAPRGRRPNAAKAAKVNGNHVQTNGVTEVAGSNAPPSNGVVAGEASEAPAVKPAISSAKRKVMVEDEEDEVMVNGGANGITSTSSKNAVGSETSTLPNGQIHPAAENSAKDATSAIIANTPQLLQAHATNGHRNSATPGADGSLIRPTTEAIADIIAESKKAVNIKPKDIEMRDKLYKWCTTKKPIGEIYSIDELKKANITHNDQDLLHICQLLVTRLCFAPMTLNRGIVYKTRSTTVATKLAQLSQNHIVIYSLVENTGGSGAWLRPLESKSRLHQSIVRKCLKELLTLKVISEIKSAESSRKVYISVDIRPDEKHIGGGFMDDGKFDDGMISSLTYVALQYLTRKSWFKSDIRVSDSGGSHGAEKTLTKNKNTSKSKEKDKPVTTIIIDDATGKSPATTAPRGPPYPPWTRDHRLLLPQHPNFYTHYPTTIDVMLALNESGVVKDVVLTLKDTTQLLTKMAFDGHVERMRDPSGELNMKEPRWRACKRTWRRNLEWETSQHFSVGELGAEGFLLPGNGMSQVPCARCPVKMKCKPGGVVNPEECKYLGDWLDF